MPVTLVVPRFRSTAVTVTVSPTTTDAGDAIALSTATSNVFPGSSIVTDALLLPSSVSS